MFLLVAALGWRDVSKARSTLPTTLIDISEKNTGQGFFEAGQSALTPDTAQAVARVAQQVVQSARARAQSRERGANHLQVIGYASPEGKRNQQLAEDRAMAVRNYLVNELRMPDDCVVVASYSDSHSPLLQGWLRRGNTLTAFRQLGTSDAQKRALGVSNADLAKERRVSILAVFHTDSTCQLSRIDLSR
ncbi:MAG TPA: OmpA family protein [Vicinamibacterales bacterium]|nr:OmpA family protein [Vicinamibacterales bacterium]